MKIKNLFAVAALLMGSTSAFAAVVTEQDYTYEGLVYILTQDDNGTPADPTDDIYYASVKKVSDDATYKAKTTWEIPENFKALAGNGALAPFTDMTLSVIEIRANAFADNSNITSITFAKAANITAIGAGAFSKTSITSLDLSGTKILTLNQLFDNLNTKVTEIKLPATLRTIGANAFDGLSKLNSIVFTAQTSTNPGLTINADAFKNTMALKTLTLPAKVASIAANAFKQTYLTTLTFTGDLGAGAVATGAFVKNVDQALTVNFTPTLANEKNNSFAQDAFASANSNVWVTFTTTNHYGEVTLGTLAADTKGNVLYGAKLVYAALTIPVANNGSGSFYYAGYTTPAGGIMIAKKQGEKGDINVMVYGAYFDYGTTAKTSAVIMEQMHLIGGKYYIPGGTSIIIKSSSKDDVEYTIGDDGTGYDSQNYKTFDGGTTYTTVNKIKVYSPLADTYAASIVASEGKPCYFLKPIAEYGFGWTQFADDRVVKTGQLYLVFNSSDAAPARIDVIWADGSEEDEVTAIQNVNAAVKEAGAIYNLAGQKVSASYKGVVIKDGKKFIQK